MFTDKSKFVKYKDLKWSGILKGIKKTGTVLQPLFEAFTNSIEAIKLRQKTGESFEPYINIVLSYNAGTNGEGVDLSSLIIEDNGIGFDQDNYNRLLMFKDDTKGFNNRGSGRIQMIHTFQQAKYESIYKDGGSLKKRSFVLSKLKPFIDNNTIVYNIQEPIDTPDDVKTSLKLFDTWDEKDASEYAKYGCDDIKNAIVNHYLLALCNLKSSLPSINIIYQIGGVEKDRAQIQVEDIPDPTHTNISISVPKCKMSDDMKRVESVVGDSVTISVLPYKINFQNLPCSEIKVTSKGEISETTKVKLTCIDPNAILEGNRFLFLLSSDYFDNIDSDERGNIEILDKTELKKRAKSQGYIEEQIVLNDIQVAVNSKACELYSEISTKQDEFRNKLEQLKKDYLLSEDALSDVVLSDSIDDVFKKAYTYDAKIMASQNAAYEESVQALNELSPASEDYQNKLSTIVDSLVESLPLQNRTTLTKYVTRRKMVIEMMDKILHRMTQCQIEAKRNEDEKLLHNLIFKQHSNNPLYSDLWLLNEEYMYYKGVSESRLSDVTLDGEKIFKKEFTEEEERYLNSLREKRLDNRTDVLLFPSEGKCVIVEFKNPNVNVSDCLDQISKYAYFIRNFTCDKFKFLTFYGYLIGEAIEARDVFAHDGDFQGAPNLDYLFRHPKTIRDDSGSNQNGTLYQEVIKFSVLKQRAELRNKAFIDRLMNNDVQEEEESRSIDVD